MRLLKRSWSGFSIKARGDPFGRSLDFQYDRTDCSQQLASRVDFCFWVLFHPSFSHDWNVSRGRCERSGGFAHSWHCVRASAQAAEEALHHYVGGSRAQCHNRTISFDRLPDQSPNESGLLYQAVVHWSRRIYHAEDEYPGVRRLELGRNGHDRKRENNGGVVPGVLGQGRLGGPTVL